VLLCLPVVLRTQLVISLEKNPELRDDPPKALIDAFVKTHAALMVPTGGRPIQHMTSGTTCVAVYFRDRDYWTAHAGDSRAVIAMDTGKDIPEAKSLTKDHKPDDPEEMKRIIEWGGFVSPSPEPGISARVWLNPEFTMIGLAMSRSIGELI
jgi:serine/threonine protein phosphatase PrpC